MPVATTGSGSMMRPGSSRSCPRKNGTANSRRSRLADIHIVREHALGLEPARRLAFRWAEVAEKKLDMQCTYTEGDEADVVGFRRPGAHGELRVSGTRFELSARLGLVLGVFKH